MYPQGYMHMHKKRILGAVSVYLALFMLLVLLSFIGDNDKESVDNALKYFSESDIKTGKLFFLHGLIPSAINKIVSLLILLFIIFKKSHERVAEFLSKKIRNEFLICFFSFFILFLILAAVKIPLNIYSGFYRDRLFSLSEINFTTWLQRYTGFMILGVMVMTITVGVIILLIRNTRRYMIYIPAADRKSVV